MISDDTISPGKSTPSQQEPAANNTAFWAVSYTHLDVYKRQQYIRRFQEKRLDYATRELYDYSAEQLRALLKLSKGSDTLESA